MLRNLLSDGYDLEPQGNLIISRFKSIKCRKVLVLFSCLGASQILLPERDGVGECSYKLLSILCMNRHSATFHFVG